MKNDFRNNGSLAGSLIPVGGKAEIIPKGTNSTDCDYDEEDDWLDDDEEEDWDGYDTVVKLNSELVSDFTKLLQALSVWASRTSMHDRKVIYDLYKELLCTGCDEAARHIKSAIDGVATEQVPEKYFTKIRDHRITIEDVVNAKQTNGIDWADIEKRRAGQIFKTYYGYSRCISNYEPIVDQEAIKKSYERVKAHFENQIIKAFGCKSDILSKRDDVTSKSKTYEWIKKEVP